MKMYILILVFISTLVSADEHVFESGCRDMQRGHYTPKALIVSGYLIAFLHNTDFIVNDQAKTIRNMCANFNRDRTDIAEWVIHHTDQHFKEKYSQTY